MKTHRLALVDDHRLFRKGIRALLQDMPEVDVRFEAANGHELLDTFPNCPVDLVLLDMSMPGMDGLATLIELRKIAPAVKVVFLTVHQDEQLILTCMEHGANGFLAKDDHPDEMENGIRKVCDTGFYFNDRVGRIMQTGLRKWKSGSRENMLDLNERELEVLRLICAEFTTQEIADQLHLSPRTIEGYRERLLEKTEARNIAGLVVYSARRGWLDTWFGPPPAAQARKNPYSLRIHGRGNGSRKEKQA